MKSNAPSHCLRRWRLRWVFTEKGISSSRPTLSGTDPPAQGSINSPPQQAVQQKVVPGLEFNGWYSAETPPRPQYGKRMPSMTPEVNVLENFVQTAFVRSV